LTSADEKIEKRLRRISKANKLKTSSLEIAMDSMTSLKNRNQEAIEKQKLRMQCEIAEKIYENEQAMLTIKHLCLAQNRTNDILTDSLRQLNKAHLLLRSTDNANEETVSQFEALVEKIECSSVQFRDALLVESNHDEVIDQIVDSPVRTVLDPWAPACTDDVVGTVDTTAGIDDDDGSPHIVTVPDMSRLDGNATVNGEGDEEETTTTVWRPPTPPRASPNSQKPADVLEQVAASLAATSSAADTNELAKVLHITKEECPPVSSLDATFDCPQPVVHQTLDATFEVGSLQRTSTALSPPNMDMTFEVSSVVQQQPSNMDMTFDVKPPSSMDVTFDVSAVQPPAQPSRTVTVSPVADTTVVLEEPTVVHASNEPVFLSSGTAVTSSSDRVVAAAASLPSLKAGRKPNYMTATTASTHRFRLPSADGAAAVQVQQQRTNLKVPESSTGRIPVKKVGRSPSPQDGRVGGHVSRPATTRPYLQPQSIAKLRKARTPSPKSAAAAENSNPLRNANNQHQLAKSLAAKSRQGSETTTVKRPFLGRSVSTSALKQFNK